MLMLTRLNRAFRWPSLPGSKSKRGLAVDHESLLPKNPAANAVASDTCLGIWFACGYSTIITGNYSAIFWGIWGFTYWDQLEFFPTAAWILTLLVVLACLVTPLAVWTLPAEHYVRNWGQIALPLSVLPCVLFGFSMLRFSTSHSEEFAMLIGATMTIMETILVGLVSRLLFGRWPVQAILALLCGVVGAFAGLLHIGLASTIT